MGFNIGDPVGSLRSGADKSTEWYKDKMNPKNPTDTEKNYYDNPNPFADFEMSGTADLYARNLFQSQLKFLKI